MKKVTTIFVLFIMLQGSLITIISITPSNVNAYTPHGPIEISGNADFASQAANESWLGNGTFGNPYIIENYEITTKSINETGISIINTTVYFEIKNCSIQIPINPSIALYLENVTHGNIDDSIFSDNYRGLWLDNSSNINIRRSNFIGNSWGIMFVSSDNNGISHVTSNNNSNGIYFENSSYNNISNSSISMNTLFGIYMTFESNYNIIYNNNVSINNDTGWSNILLETNSNNNTISNNFISYGGESGIELRESPDNYILNNTLTENRNNGIKVIKQSHRTIIHNNIIYRNIMGVLLAKSDNISIINNTIYSNAGMGIYYSESNYYTISNNLIFDQDEGLFSALAGFGFSIYKNEFRNNNIGIYLEILSSDNTIFNNIFLNNTVGIEIRADDNEIFYNNFINQSSYGVMIFGGNSNLLHHNNFYFNNGANESYNSSNIQVSDDGINRWNMSYPKGGNYWIDYDGIDFNSTAFQDVPPPDGFGDTPYVIDGGSKDNYPLMEPVDIDKPSAPENLKLIEGNSFINLSWETPTYNGDSEIILYYIYRNDTPGIYDIIPVNQLWYNDTNVINGMNYSYNVSAVNTEGEGPRTINVFGAPSSSATIPSEPQNLQENSGDLFINLTWNPPASDGGSVILFYNIYRNGTSGIYDSVPASKIWYYDNNVTNGITYTYNVSAVNTIGEGLIATIEATPITVPFSPENLLAEEGYGYVNISWDPPLSDGGSSIINYTIYRNGTIGSYAIVSAEQYWYNDTNIVNGTTYTYNITATNAKGEGSNSNDVLGTPLTPSVPSKPQNPQSNSGDGYVNISWLSPTFNGGFAITYYNIYRNDTIGIYATVPENQQWYNDTIVINDLNYTYNITARNDIGEGTHSDDVQGMPFVLTPPSVPRNLEAEGDDGYITLVWESPSDDGGTSIIEYYIYRNGSIGIFAIVPTGQLWYFDTNVINNIAYTYNVSAVNGVGEGPQSSDITVTPVNFTIPSEPRNPLAEEGNNFVNLTWLFPIDEGGSPIIFYKIYRSDIIGIYQTISKDQLWFLDTNVTNGITYIYQVSAENSIGEGPKSAGVSAIPKTIPSGPENLQIIISNGSLNLTWDTPSSNGGSQITGYNVYRDGTSGAYAWVPSYQLWFNDDDIITGTIYTYHITAINDVGEGTSYPEASAKAVSVPSEPFNIFADSGDSFINLTWSIPISDGSYPITNYTIYQGEAEGAEIFLREIGNIIYFNDTDVINNITYFYIIKAVNSLGEGLSSITVNATPRSIFVPTNQPPICSIAYPSNDSTVNGNIKITGTASDSDGTVQKIQIKIDDGEWIEANGTTSWSYDLDTTSFSNNEHTIYTRAYDGTNYSSETSIAIQIDNKSPGPIERSIFEEAWFWIMIISILVVLVILLLLSKRKGNEPEKEIDASDLEDEESGVEEEPKEEIEEEKEEGISHDAFSFHLRKAQRTINRALFG